MSVQKITQLSLLTTIALTIFMIEAALPTIVPIPGIKLGLANIVTLFILKRYTVKDAGMVLLARILLAGIFAGQMVYFLYSICGGVMCLLAMAAVNRLLKRQYIYITSMVGAVFHNIGQVGVAILILQMPGILVYVPFLILNGVVTGLFTGLALHYFEKYIPRTTGRIF